MFRGLLVPAAIVSLAGLGEDAAEAKPKRTYNGCTQEQLQTPEAGQCLNQITGDLTQGRSYTHVVYCDSGGHILCCLTDNQTGQILDNSCDTLTIRRPPERFTPKAGTGGLMMNQ